MSLKETYRHAPEVPEVPERRAGQGGAGRGGELVDDSENKNKNPEDRQRVQFY